MIRCADGYDPLLPRPMSFHRFRDRNGERQFAILYDVRGRGTAWLSQRQAGEELSVLWPLGKGYAVEREAQHLLLVAGGSGVAGGSSRTGRVRGSCVGKLRPGGVASRAMSR